jgi:hypothetical protein
VSCDVVTNSLRGSFATDVSGSVSLPFDRIESVSQREFRPKMPNSAKTIATAHANEHIKGSISKLERMMPSLGPNSRSQVRSARTPAERMRLFRRRRKFGRQVVKVEVDPGEVDALIDRGYLPPKDRDDRGLLAAAVTACFSDALMTP